MYYWPTQNFRITLPFAAAYPAEYYSVQNPHRGLDLNTKAGESGTPVVMPWDGLVTDKLVLHPTRGNALYYTCSLPFDVIATNTLGQTVRYLTNTPFEMCMFHFKETYVEKGQSLLAGHTVGAIGQTGLAGGPHLHFQINVDNTPVDPLPFLNAALAHNNAGVEADRRLRVFNPNDNQELGMATLKAGTDKAYLFGIKFKDA